MTIARRQLINVSVTRWYHCMSRCVRGASLLCDGPSGRKEWIENRIEQLAQIFALGVGGFSLMDNHLHLLLRLESEVAAGWSDDDVVRRWWRLFPPRDKSRQPLPISDAWVQGRLKDIPWVARARERLQSIGWFMKCLKEPLSRQANREDQCRGAFFQGRYRSVAILDIEDRRRFDSPREGMFEGLSIGNYLLLVDFTGRVFREGKARISADLAGILDRIGSSAQRWQLRMEKLRDGRSFGRFFASSRDKLREIAHRLNVRRLVNLVGCAAP